MAAKNADALIESGDDHVKVAVAIHIRQDYAADMTRASIRNAGLEGSIAVGKIDGYVRPRCASKQKVRMSVAVKGPRQCQDRSGAIPDRSLQDERTSIVTQ